MIIKGDVTNQSAAREKRAAEVLTSSYFSLSATDFQACLKASVTVYGSVPCLKKENRKMCLVCMSCPCLKKKLCQLHTGQSLIFP